MERPTSQEQPPQPERPARKRRTKLAAGTTPPPLEAAKSAPQPEEIRELPEHLLKEEPPAIPDIPPSADTQEALSQLREIQTQRELSAAKEERWKGYAEIQKARQDIENVPDMTDEARAEDPRVESDYQKDKGWAGRAIKEIEDEKAKKAEENRKKPWWKRLLETL